ncbi:M28 family peptidase [bacterium]|nr:M28 family peptidase [candidate division CSSED10-310 bacterium]
MKELRIKVSKLMEHVKHLASAKMRGRMPGDIGYERAARYVETFFSSVGLEPMGDDGKYRQAFTLETNLIKKASVSYTDGKSRTRTLKLGTDFICRGLTGSGKFVAEPVFVGYACEKGTVSELEDIDVCGKIALTYKHPAPWQNDVPHELPREKAHRLKKYGAVALAVVPNPNRSAQDRLSASLMEKDTILPDFPMIVLSEDFSTEIFNQNGMTASSIQYGIDIQNESRSMALPGSFNLDISTESNLCGSCWNIVGLLKGRNPTLENEAIVIGAHLDHVGIQAEDIIFYGAQDNASGVSALLEIARLFSMNPRPARSILFVVFGAEESGLIGARHYEKYPVWPMNQVKAMFNLDCMGAGDGLDVRGRNRYPELFERFDRINREEFVIPDTNADHPAGGADAEPFENAGIPNMFVVSRNPYKHLHLQTDLPHTLNPELFQKISNLVFRTVAEMAEIPLR